MSESLEPLDLTPPDYNIVARWVEGKILRTVVVMDDDVYEFGVDIKTFGAGLELQKDWKGVNNGNQ